MAGLQLDHYAIVIGLSAYPRLGDPPGAVDLKGPENDADAVYEWLVGPEEGGLPAANVKRVCSRDYTAPPNSRPFRDELNEDVFNWINQKAENGRKIGRRLYIYASGHGFSPRFGQGCLLTGSATETDVTANISPSLWLEYWQDAGYFREFVLWMDCCMDRAVLVQPQLPPSLPVNGGTAPGYSFVAFAASRPLKAVEKPIPEDGGKVHGVFTWNLLRGLRGAAANRFGTVTGSSLGDWLRHSQLSWLEGPDLTNPDIAKEPEIVDDDSGLVFKRGLAPPSFKVDLAFPAAMDITTARIWSGANPSAGAVLEVVGNRLTVDLPAGLHLVETPDGAIRHGFAVTRDGTVEVTDTGTSPAPGRLVDGHGISAKASDSGMLPSPTGSFSLSVQPDDATAEVRLLGSRFETIDADAGSLTARLPFGLYAMRIRVGRKTVEKVILLDADWPATARDTPKVPPITSAAPLPLTAATHELQAAAVADSQSRVDVPAGVGAELLVMPRVWSPMGDATGPQSWLNVAVLDASGQLVADLSKDGVRRETLDPYATCSVALDPGAYVLRHPGERGGMVANSLFIPAGWRLEAYLLHRPGFSDSISIPRMTFLMRRIGAAWGTAEDVLFEKARVALADERPILNEELSGLLLQKFHSPLAGIVGAHLLLIGVEHGAQGPALEMLDVVVRNLRMLVGSEHPDVEALSLACTDRSLRRKTPITTAPMFDRSWRMLVDGCRDNPNLLPLSLWQQVHARFGGQAPFFTWVTDLAVQSDFRIQLAKTMFAHSGAVAPAAAGAMMPVQAAAVFGPTGRSRARYLPRAPAQAGRPEDPDLQCAALLGVPPSALPTLRLQYRSLPEESRV